MSKRKLSSEERKEKRIAKKQRMVEKRMVEWNKIATDVYFGRIEEPNIEYYSFVHQDDKNWLRKHGYLPETRGRKKKIVQDDKKDGLK